MRCFNKYKKHIKPFYNQSRRKWSEKPLKWYDRPVDYELKDNHRFKKYLVRKHNNIIELFPLFNPKEYHYSVIWLYSGDTPDYMIDHLFENNNNFLPDKVTIFYHFPRTSNSN